MVNLQHNWSQLRNYRPGMALAYILLLYDWIYFLPEILYTEYREINKLQKPYRLKLLINSEKTTRLNNCNRYRKHD